jgi:heme iron utilization protein
VADLEAIARKARALLRRIDAGVLSTQSLTQKGWPFGSLAPFALTHEARPILLVSALAEHTRNLAADPRCCLTVFDPNRDDKQAAGRASLLGEARPLPEPAREAAAERYLALFPEQRGLLSMRDFGFWSIEPARARWIGGFGEIHWIERDAWLLATPAWRDGERSIVSHMNEDHADALAAISKRLLGEDGGDAELVAVDPEGFHVRTARGIHWLAFGRASHTADEVRAEMVRLTREARQG